MGGPISFLFFCFPYLVVAALCLDVCLHGVESKSTSWSTNPNTSTPFHTQRCRSPQRRDGDGETLGMGAATMQLAAKGSDSAVLGERMATALERKMATAWCLSRRRRRRLAGRVVGPNKVRTR